MIGSAGSTGCLGRQRKPFGAPRRMGMEVAGKSWFEGTGVVISVASSV